MKKTIFGLLCVFIINNDITYAVAPEMLAMPQICPSGGSREAIACKIKEMFPEEPDVMLAIAMAESNLNNDAVNWNCRYNGVATSCKKEDRHRAFSLDKGIFQINNAKEEDLTIDGNLKAARKLYETKRNKGHWVVFSTGAYLKYLPEARSMIE
jgi:hypothetical protein